MTDLLLAALLAVPSPVAVRMIPRFDGLLLELSSAEPFDAAVDVTGYVIGVRTAVPVELPADAAPFWILGWEPDADSCGFRIETGGEIDSVSFAFSSDSRILLLFLRAEEPMLFPTLSWNGPPEEPPRAVERK